MPLGQRVLFRKYPMCGNGGGFMSQLPGAQSGQLPPEFRSGPPSQLASWTDVGQNSGPASDVPELQNRIRELIGEGHKSCRHNASDVSPTDVAVQTPASPDVGIQFRSSVDHSALLWHDARRDV